MADELFSAPYVNRLAMAGVSVNLRQRNTRLATVFSLMTLPFLMPLYWRRKIELSTDSQVDGVVCHVENPNMLAGYLSLLQPEISPTFVVAPEYRAAMSAAQNQNVRVVQLGLSSEAYKELKELLATYGRSVSQNFREYSFLGEHVLRFANKLVHGRIRAPSGENYHLLVCEHHDLTKSIRNEFIRKAGGRSVLFPYSALYVLRYYADEYYENYDVVLSPGRHYDDILKENQAVCRRIFPVGTYSIHKNGLGLTPARLKQKLRDIREFAGGCKIVTILCPGVCKPTFTSEEKLMRLAQTISEIDGIKVIIRQKPFTPDAMYSGFYEGFAEGRKGILLTGMEYDLFDFLPVTDLFITSYSTSACELAVCGAKVMFVDYLEQNDRFIFWEKEIAGELLVSEDDVLEKAQEVLGNIDDEQGSYRQGMATFAKYIGYQFPDYEDYRRNLMNVFNQELGIVVRERGEGNESASESS